MVAHTEDEYVRLAIQLASDIRALSELRMTLRELMSRSPVCNGAKFVNGLEYTYRKLWHRYCEGDVPSLRRMELLQPQRAPEDLSAPSSEPVVTVNSEENHHIHVKTNGVGSAALSSPSSSSSGGSNLRETSVVKEHR